MTTHGDIRIGISGWTYARWRGVFFPKGLPQKRELAYAAGIFRSIEINGTFYGLQRPGAFAAWADRTPDDFVFAVKAPRFLTHILRVRKMQPALANFLASGVLRLGAKLGPLLWQFPPTFRFDSEQMQRFLDELPHDTAAAATMARKHDSHVAGHAWTETDENRPLRHAVEIRHDSFAAPAFLNILRARNVAVVCADTVEWPRLIDVTADFVYCRLHGSEELYASGYDDVALDDWARRVKMWAAGDTPDDPARLAAKARRQRRDVFVFFDNDVKVRAPADAQALMARLQQGETRPK
jgi:uncharacterized protein YecE (DUF72 family)